MTEHTHSELLNIFKDTITAWKHLSPAQIALKTSKLPLTQRQWLIDQIVSRKILQKKAPELAQNPLFACPPQQLLAQASSELSAKFKQSLVQANTFLDLSAGTGIDAYWLSKNAQKTVLVEPNPLLASLLIHNYTHAFDQKDTIYIHNQKAEDFLPKNNAQFELVFVDPSRRDHNEKQLIELKDCLPNVIELLPLIKKCSKQLLLKLSPLIEIKSAFKQLQFVQQIFVLAHKNDCKEVLFLLQFDQTPISFEKCPISCVELANQTNTLQLCFQAIEKASVNYCQKIHKYIYDPGVAIRKV